MPLLSYSSPSDSLIDGFLSFLGELALPFSQTVADFLNPPPPPPVSYTRPVWQRPVWQRPAWETASDLPLGGSIPPPPPPLSARGHVPAPYTGRKDPVPYADIPRRTSFLSLGDPSAPGGTSTIARGATPTAFVAPRLMGEAFVDSHESKAAPASPPENKMRRTRRYPRRTAFTNGTLFPWYGDPNMSVTNGAPASRGTYHGQNGNILKVVFPGHSDLVWSTNFNDEWAEHLVCKRHGSWASSVVGKNVLQMCHGIHPEFIFSKPIHQVGNLCPLWCPRTSQYS